MGLSDCSYIHLAATESPFEFVQSPLFHPRLSATSLFLMRKIYGHRGCIGMSLMQMPSSPPSKPEGEMKEQSNLRRTPLKMQSSMPSGPRPAFNPPAVLMQWVTNFCLETQENSFRKRHTMLTEPLSPVCGSQRKRKKKCR